MSSAAPTPGTAGRNPLRRGTLSRRLALRVAALVACVAVVLGLVSTVAVSRFMTSQLDTQLTTALDTQSHPPNPTQADDQQVCLRSTTSGTTGFPMGGTRALGLQPGSIVVTYVPELKTACNQQIKSGASSQVTTAQMNQLISAARTDHPSTVQVDGLGSFRAQKAQSPVTHNGTQYDRVQIVALPTNDVRHIIKEMLILEGITTLLALGTAMVLSRTLVVRSLRPLNRLADAANTVSHLELDRGEVSLAVRIPASEANPANEVGQVGHAFNHMLNNVEGALAARQHSETKVRQFVADASHELRNPLAAIRGYSELTRRDRDQLPPDTAYAMGRIEAESERMSKLVEDMLLLARLDNDPNLELQPTDVVEVVLNAVSDAQVTDRSHAWQLDLPDDGGVVAMADGFRLHQVVVNLLANARKHTPEGTVVTTGVHVEGPWAVVTVSDNGPGIDPSIRDTLFERFARADVARAHNPEGSTGLGLAIVAAVMDAHHGTATVDSEPGRTTFALRLPLA